MSAMMSLMFSAMVSGQISTFMQSKRKALIAASRLYEVIDREPAIDSAGDGGERPARCSGAIAFKDVTFAYPTRPDVPIFRNFSLRVGAGQTVALVGESGGGKSTVISLLTRFYDPEGGVVELDGMDVRSLNVSWLRSQIGLVSQEPVLFNATIGENIAYGKAGATQAEIEAAARAANAHDFIAGFPQGYSTTVGDKGAQLSGGQKQRVAIARALIRDPTVLLLDEATSALDTESERVVQAALDALLRDKARTTVVIAHRLSTIRDADSLL